jgi:amidohydrolase
MSLEFLQQIVKDAEAIFPQVQKFRRHLHKNPELSFQEYKTQSYIHNKLQEIGIESKPVAETGLYGFIKGDAQGKKITLRAETDALPIQEDTGLDFASVNQGIMHACGHDVHSACLYGALAILKQYEYKIPNQIQFIFQPAEEKLPGGATKVLESGVIQDFNPDVLIAQHVLPELEVGNIGFRSGLYMASADEIYITIKGKGGHGAMPHTTIDPIVIASQLISNLQSVVSRYANPTIPTILSFGKIVGLGVTNIIPGEVKIEGTFRTYDENQRKELHKLITSIVTNVCESYGAEVDLNIVKGYPHLKNDENFTSQVKEIVSMAIGDKQVVDIPIRPTAEDFAWYGEHYPIVFYRLGVGNKEKGITYQVHHPKFTIDEEALKYGVIALATSALI